MATSSLRVAIGVWVASMLAIVIAVAASPAGTGGAGRNGAPSTVGTGTDVAGPETAAYDVAATATWRVTREAELTAPDGWLSLAGLHFLDDGDSTIGTDPANVVALPAGSGPARAGTVHVRGTRVQVDLVPGVTAQLNGQPATGRIELRPAVPAAQQLPDRLTLGRVNFHVHYSGDRLGLRVRDPESEGRRAFTGLRWYDIDPRWQIAGQFHPYDTPRPMTVPNVLGDAEPVAAVGEVSATIAGTPVRLLAFQAPQNRLWIVFRDATAPAETYRIRFLYADAPQQGRVLLDFNRAYNPPCAFNPYTTCPFPPAQNQLAARIPAGELTYTGPRPAANLTASR